MASKCAFLLLLPLEDLLFMITIVLLSFAPPSVSSSFYSSSAGTNATNKRIGFKAPLIHSVYSPRSPFYDPKLTESDRIQVLLDLSYSRYHQYVVESESPSPYIPHDDYTDAMEAPVSPVHDRYGGGEYMLGYQIGTPPIETFAVIDTGSSFTWLQCLPCELCFKQKTPFYDPKKSSTFARLNCNDKNIKNCSSSSKIGSRCNFHDNSCSYAAHYFDKSFTIGDLAMETLIFESDVRPPDSILLPNVPFGCGHKNNFTYQRMPPGVMGLDRGEISFISQLGKNPKFSYCLLPMGSSAEGETSYMHFGPAALFVGGKSPIVRNPKFPSRYFLSVDGISVGNERLSIPPGTFKVKPNGNGGFAIDSGTPFTILHPDAFHPLVDGIKMKTPLTDLGRHYSRFKLCYWCTWSDILNKTPNVKFHFTGVDLELSKDNLWIKVQSGLLWNHMWCLAMKPSPNHKNIFSIMGNRQQRNVNVGYDLEHNVISFKNVDCTRS